MPTKENLLLDRFTELFVLDQFKHVQSQDSFEQSRQDPHLFRGVPEETSDLLSSKAQKESPLCQSALDWEQYSCGAMWDWFQKLQRNFILVCSLTRPQRTHFDNARTGFNMIIHRAQQKDHLTRKTIHFCVRMNTVKSPSPCDHSYLTSTRRDCCDEKADLLKSATFCSKRSSRSFYQGQRASRDFSQARTIIVSSTLLDNRWPNTKSRQSLR